MSGVKDLVRRSFSFKSKKKYEERLLEASLEGDSEKVAILISKCEDVSKPREDGCTPLHAACNGGFTECVRLLLEAGADASRLFQGWSPLHVASAAGRHQCALLILRNETNRLMVDSTEGEPDQRTALHLAVSEGHLDVVKALLGVGANPERRDRTGKTALALGLDQGQVDVARFLIQNKISNVNAPDARHMTPLMIACIHGQNDMVELLIKNQADPFKVDERSRTALILAQQNRREKCAQLMTDAESSWRAQQKTPEAVQKIMSSLSPDMANPRASIHSVASLQGNRLDVKVRSNSMHSDNDDSGKTMEVRRTSSNTSAQDPAMPRSNSSIDNGRANAQYDWESLSHMSKDQVVTLFLDIQKQSSLEKQDQWDLLRQIQDENKFLSLENNKLHRSHTELASKVGRLQESSSINGSPASVRRATLITPNHVLEQESLLEDTIAGLKAELARAAAKLSSETGQRKRADDLESLLSEANSNVEFLMDEIEGLKKALEAQGSSSVGGSSADSAVGGVASPISPAEGSRYKAKISSLEEELHTAKTDCASANARVLSLKKQLQETFDLEQRLLDTEGQLSRANRQVSSLNEDLDAMRSQLGELTANLHKSQMAYRELIHSDTNTQVRDWQLKYEQEAAIHQDTLTKLAEAKDNYESVADNFKTYQMQLQAERSLRMVAENVLREEQDRSATMERRLSNASSHRPRTGVSGSHSPSFLAPLVESHSRSDAYDDEEQQDQYPARSFRMSAPEQGAGVQRAKSISVSAERRKSFRSPARGHTNL